MCRIAIVGLTMAMIRLRIFNLYHFLSVDHNHVRFGLIEVDVYLPCGVVCAWMCG